VRDDDDVILLEYVDGSEKFLVVAWLMVYSC